MKRKIKREQKLGRLQIIISMKIIRCRAILAAVVCLFVFVIVFNVVFNNQHLFHNRANFAPKSAFKIMQVKYWYKKGLILSFVGLKMTKIVPANGREPTRFEEEKCSQSYKPTREKFIINARQAVIFAASTVLSTKP